jgi:integrase
VEIRRFREVFEGLGTPAQCFSRRAGAGIEHRRIYDLRHTYATWSLAAGVSLFALSRRMGTSLAMIDATYGHLAPDAEDQERALLDAFDGTFGQREGSGTLR